MEGFHRIFFIIFASVGAVISRGIAGSLIWNLFVPKFFGLPSLPVLIAIALSTLMSVLVPTVAPNTGAETKYSDLYRLLFIVYLAPWLSYLFALTVTSFYY